MTSRDEIEIGDMCGMKLGALLLKHHPAAQKLKDFMCLVCNGLFGLPLLFLKEEVWGARLCVAEGTWVLLYLEVKRSLTIPIIGREVKSAHKTRVTNEHGPILVLCTCTPS